MTPERRAFVDAILPLLPPADTVPPPLSLEQRAFVDGFLSLARQPAQPMALSESQRAFVDGFVALAAAVLPSDAPHTVFERVVMDRWQAITWRVQGAVAAGFADLDANQHRLLRALEDTPSLLGPLGKARDEVTHSRLLGWALRRSGDLGRTLRQAFLAHVGIDQPVDGWVITTESTIGPGCRVDVDVVVPGRWRCLIEVKIDAPERKDQLDDYRAYLDAACADQDLDGDLVFMTVDGRAGDTDARHHPLSFRDLLIGWLPVALRPEPDAGYLGLWLSTIGQSLYGISQPGPAMTWGFSERVKVLRFLEDLGEAQ